MKEKVIEMDKEIHKLREDFEDTHLNTDDRKALAEALDDEHEGRTISGSELRKELGL